MAPQYPRGRSQLDDCSRSTERMGKQKSEVGKVYNTGLRHRNVSRGFGDSRAERWGTRMQQVEQVLVAASPIRPFCPITIDQLSCPSQLSCRGGRRLPRPSSTAASFPPAEICFLLRYPSSWPQVRCWSGLHGVTPSGKSGESCVVSEEGGLLCQCPRPFPRRLSLDSEDSPAAADLLRKSVGSGIFLVQNLAAK